MLELEELKNYLRVDGSEDDAILTLLVSAADEYFADAGIPETAKTTSKYKLAVMLFVALNYENRDPAIEMNKFSFSLESLILQLKVG